MSNITHLYLDDNELKAQAAQYIAYSQFLQKLKVLSLKNNKIQNEGFRHLMVSDNFMNMTNLSVEYNKID